jgi:hypothetical protein
MAWAKLDTDILCDPKLMRAARKGAKGLHLLPWLIAFAKEADDEGRLTVGGEPAEPEDIADLIPGVTPRMVAECIDSLSRIKVLVPDGGALKLAAWERRSGAKPSDSKEAIRERVTAHRERKRNAVDVTPGNALQVDDGNATEKRREEKSREEIEGEKRRSRTRSKALPAVAGSPPAVNGSGPQTDPLPTGVEPVTWTARVAAVLTQRGIAASPGKVGALLKAGVDTFGEGKITRALESFLDNGEALYDQKPQFLTLETFAKNPGVWVEKITPLNERPKAERDRAMREAAGVA